MKSPLLAAALSFAVAGLGQLYAGRFWRGLWFLVLELSTFGFLAVSYYAAVFLNLTVSVMAAVDAYFTAKKANLEDKADEPGQDMMQQGIRVY